MSRSAHQTVVMQQCTSANAERCPLRFKGEKEHKKKKVFNSAHRELGLPMLVRTNKCVNTVQSSFHVVLRLFHNLASRRYSKQVRFTRCLRRSTPQQLCICSHGLPFIFFLICFSYTANKLRDIVQVLLIPRCVRTLARVMFSFVKVSPTQLVQQFLSVLFSKVSAYYSSPEEPYLLRSRRFGGITFQLWEEMKRDPTKNTTNET